MAEVPATPHVSRAEPAVGVPPSPRGARAPQRDKSIGDLAHAVSEQIMHSVRLQGGLLPQMYADGSSQVIGTGMESPRMYGVHSRVKLVSLAGIRKALFPATT
jgi:hypothetical protein